jgi:hypothetical protein
LLPGGAPATLLPGSPRGIVRQLAIARRGRFRLPCFPRPLPLPLVRVSPGRSLNPDLIMQTHGRYLSLPPPRRLVNDMLHFARQVPSVPVERRINVAPLAEARTMLPDRPGWCALFTKAYGIVTAAFPALRRAYLGFPWPRLYEHPFAIASVAIERTYDGEPGVFFGHIRCPERQAIVDLEAALFRYKNDPIESIGLFRRGLAVSRLPRLLRRLMWWYGLNSSGPKRAKRLGTFGVSVYSGLGAASLHPLSVLTTTLNYGVIDGNGDVDVRIVYDHRVMDGGTVARALAWLEQVLNREMRDELCRLREAHGRAARPSRVLETNGRLYVADVQAFSRFLA